MFHREILKNTITNVSQRWVPPLPTCGPPVTHAQGQLWCGTAAWPWLGLLGKQPCGKVPRGKPCWESLLLAHPLLGIPPPRSPLHQLLFISAVPLVSSWAMLLCTGADPDPNNWPGVLSLNLLTVKLPASHCLACELTSTVVTRPALLLGLGYHGTAPLPMPAWLPLTAPTPSPGAQAALTMPWPKAKGSLMNCKQPRQQKHTNTLFFC